MGRFARALAVSALLVSTAASAEDAPDIRAMKNAAFVLGHAGPIAPGAHLNVYSSDRAAIIDSDGDPTLIAKVGRCEYAMKSKGSMRLSLNFSRVTGYESYCKGVFCGVRLTGGSGLQCVQGTGQPETCVSVLSLIAKFRDEQEKIIAAVRFVQQQNGCTPGPTPPPY